MRAAVLDRAGSPIAEREVSSPAVSRKDDVLVRVRAAGICHTDLHLERGVPHAPRTPFILGHEVAGDVVAVGPSVTDVRVGDRVVIYYYIGCGVCEACRADRVPACPRSQKIGFDRSGGWAELIVVPSSTCVPIPQGLSYAQAAVLACGGSTAEHVVARGAISPSDTLVVIGCGGVGLILIGLARHLGATVIAVDRSESSLELARRQGAAAAVHVHSEIDLGNVPKVDVVVDLVGSRDTVNAGLAILGFGGRLVLVGYRDESVEIDPFAVLAEEKVIVGSVGASRHEVEHVLERTAAGAVAPVIAQTCSLLEVNDALRALDRGEISGRVVIEP